MAGSTRDAPARRYVARLQDGPLAGTFVRMSRRHDGEPAEMLPIDGDPAGVYLLAGSPTRRGILPYRWITAREWAELRRWLHLGRNADPDSPPHEGRPPGP